MPARLGDNSPWARRISSMLFPAPGSPKVTSRPVGTLSRTAQMPPAVSSDPASSPGPPAHLLQSWGPAPENSWRAVLSRYSHRSK